MTNKLNTIKVQGGKEYAEVHTRVNYFRSTEQYKDWGQDCEIIHQTETSIIMKATIYYPDGRVASTGYAKEDIDGARINQRNHVEVCDTSAVGRALGFLGIGISQGSIASYEEVANAIANKEKDEVKETHITLDIDDGNWVGVLNYIAHRKDDTDFIDIIKTLQTKYKTIEGKTKVALKKAYEGK
tara:strand:+ start:1803 stop:2357 length:555 start_codon:yes stop_codon:yes gene_type:complete